MDLQIAARIFVIFTGKIFNGAAQDLNFRPPAPKMNALALNQITARLAFFISLLCLFTIIALKKK